MLHLQPPSMVGDDKPLVMHSLSAHMAAVALDLNGRQ